MERPARAGGPGCADPCGRAPDRGPAVNAAFTMTDALIERFGLLIIIGAR
jgi:hypothetical protein